jgi:Flp pilus assembly protein TadG
MSGSPPPRFGAEEGAAVVEASLIMGVLFLLVFGSVEFGRAFWTYNTMLLAVEEAGRYAMTHSHGPSETCSAQSQALNCPLLSDTPLANCSAARARQVLSAYQVGSVEVSVGEDAINLPNTMTICASSTFGFTAPNLLPFGPLDLMSWVTVPLI